MVSGAVNAQLQPLLLPGRVRPWDPAERREGSTKPSWGKDKRRVIQTPEGNPDELGFREVVLVQWFWGGMMRPGLCPAPCWVLAAATGSLRKWGWLGLV